MAGLGTGPGTGPGGDEGDPAGGPGGGAGSGGESAGLGEGGSDRGGAPAGALLAQNEEDEASAPSLRERVRSLEEELDEARAGARRAEQRAEAVKLLMTAEVTDLESALALVEAKLAEDGAGSVAHAVEDVRRRKRHLFESSGAASGHGAPSVMAAGVARDPRAELEELADRAAATGDRALLVRYLRLRRGEA